MSKQLEQQRFNAQQAQAFGLGLTNSHVQVNQQPIIDMSLGEPNLSQLPKEIFDFLKTRENIQWYYPSLGLPELRHAIRNQFYQHLESEQIVITPGAIGALDLILRAHVGEGAEILIPDPGFPPYQKLAQLCGYQVKKYPLRLQLENQNPAMNIHQHSLIDWEKLESQVTRKTELILINSPHNPSGLMMTENDGAQLRRLLKKYPQVSFIMDEVYRQLIFNQKQHLDFSDLLHQGYIINSFSKMCPLQGARIGWIASADYKLDKIKPFIFNTIGAVSSFGQELALYMLKNPLNDLHKYSSAMNFCVQKLKQADMNFIVPAAGFFILVKLSKNANQAVEDLKQMGLQVTSGSQFGKSTECYIRICVANEIVILEQALKIFIDYEVSIKKSKKIESVIHAN